MSIRNASKCKKKKKKKNHELHRCLGLTSQAEVNCSLYSPTVQWSWFNLFAFEYVASKEFLKILSLKTHIGRACKFCEILVCLFSYKFSSVQLLSCVWLFVTPWTSAYQASLSITNSWSLPKPMSIESVMPSNHLILCHPLLLLPLMFHSIRVFSNESALLFR